MQCEIGVYGLGVMGAGIARNMLDHGFKTAAYSVSKEERERFRADGCVEICKVCGTQEELIQSLARPRKIFLMITAGDPVDAVLSSLVPALEPGDVIFDGGNSYYEDTERRCRALEEKGIRYVGCGISGGRLGALYGPSIMPGGSYEGYRAGEKILTTIAAKADGKPCCAYIGQGGSGHYVKMVHNGIEYSILELIAEAYMIMRNGLSMSHEAVLEVFRAWQHTRLNSYLIDISVQVMEQYEQDGVPLIDRILDVAEQKGTGKWTLCEAIERGVYAPGIYESVLARSFSANLEDRRQGAAILNASGGKMELDHVEQTLGDALLLAIALSYSQGMELIRKASDENGWGIDLSALTDLWKAGCIIRSSLLGTIKEAAKQSDEPLILSEAFESLQRLEPSLRNVVVEAESAGMAPTGFAAALHYYDYYRMKDMPVRFVQALRDCFGAHTYMRSDREGHFHTDWQTIGKE